jgi:hypothetical protein
MEKRKNEKQSGVLRKPCRRLNGLSRARARMRGKTIWVKKKIWKDREDEEDWSLSL